MFALSDEKRVPVNGIEICFQEIGDPDGEPLVLIMGLAVQMLAWEDDFCRMLAERGFRVVRFDNRDVGHSTILREAGMPSRYDMFTGRRSTAAYTLSDMTGDTLGLMSYLEMDSAHVVGVSMGGMIGQTMAIEHPERVRSLVSMMSTTGNRRIGSPSIKAWGILLSRYPKAKEDYIARVRKTLTVLGSPDYPMDEERAVDLASRMWDRGHSTAGVIRQIHAIAASGDRTSGLRKLEVPATVLHGSRDPLARPAAGKATAEAIPGARLRLFEGMGHDLPEQLWPEFADEIEQLAERSGHAPKGTQAAA